MKEYLKATMWLMISCKINKTVLESQEIILDLKYRLDNDNHFLIENLDQSIIDAFSYYLESIKHLE